MHDSRKSYDLEKYAAASYELKNIFVRNAVKEVVPAVGGYANTKMATAAYLTGSYTGATGTAELATAVTPAVNVSTEHTTDYCNYYYIVIYPIVIQFVMISVFKKGNDLATCYLPLFSQFYIISNNRHKSRTNIPYYKITDL